MSVHYCEINGRNGVLRGFLHRPKSCHETDLYIYFHGFTGSRVDNYHLGTIMAKYFAKHNKQFLFFDFFGSADSDGDFTDTTLSSEIVDGEDIIEYAKSIPNVNKIHVIGHSMGGTVALKAIDDAVDSLILLAPSFDITNSLSCLIKNRKVDTKLGGYDYKGIVIGTKLFEDLKNHNSETMVLNFKNDTFLIHGTLDKSCPISDSEQFAKKYPHVKYYPIDQADHEFNNAHDRIKLFELIISITSKIQ